MRLLMTGDTAGGVLTFVSELALGLQQRGVDVTLATFGPEPRQQIDGVRWFHFTSKLEWQDDPWFDIDAAGLWLKELVGQDRPDVLHMNTLCHGDLGWNIPVVTTVHSCVWSWWSSVKQTELPAYWNRYRAAVQSSLRAASWIAVPSRALLRSLADLWSLNPAFTVVIPNGHNPSSFQPGVKEPIILSAGRFWDEGKNIDALETAASAVSWPIYLAGESEQTSNCHLLGQLSQAEMKDWYARAAIYSSMAKYEPFGLSVLEAAMSGCALVLSDLPSFREIWGDAAVFCDPKHLPETLEHLIANQQQLEEWQGRAIVRSRCFTQASMTAQYLRLYEKVQRYPCAS